MPSPSRVQGARFCANAPKRLRWTLNERFSAEGTILPMGPGTLPQWPQPVAEWGATALCPTEQEMPPTEAAGS
jgi:hypothetical protein